MNIFRYFTGSFIVTLAGLSCVYLLEGNTWTLLYLASVLALLEISLSFDNAVINAKILTGMTRFWQKMFIYIGIPIAVFGMRLIFPILLVDITTTLSFTQVFSVAINQPDAYQAAIEKAMPVISAFGGGFLWMVAMQFFCTHHSKERWIKSFEDIAIFKIRGANWLLALLVLLIISMTSLYLGKATTEIVIAYLLGVLVHETLGAAIKLINRNSQQIIKGGILSFIYLEILDASFSFDGVIGAFAITTNIYLIMIGLGIGAMYVRSLTIYFVDKKILTRFIYLDHGAHYAIAFLSIIMFIKIFSHVPEWLTASVSILFVAASLYSSILKNKK